MAENMETTEFPEADYADPMRVEGDQKEVSDLKEDEFEANQISGFLHFCNLERRKIREECPELNTAEVGRELEKRWNNADEETRSKYIKIAMNQRQRYERRMACTKRSQSVRSTTQNLNNESGKID